MKKFTSVLISFAVVGCGHFTSPTQSNAGQSSVDSNSSGGKSIKIGSARHACEIAQRFVKVSQANYIKSTHLRLCNGEEWEIDPDFPLKVGQKSGYCLDTLTVYRSICP